MRLGIIIPDGVGIKNYLYTDFPNQFLENSENTIVLIHAKLDQNLLEELNAPYGKQMQMVPLPEYREPIIARMLRESISFARLIYFARALNNPTIFKNAAPVAGNVKRKILLLICKSIGQFVSGNYASILKTERLYNKILSRTDVNTHLNLLKKLNIDVLFSLHQRPVENIPMYEAAKRLKIKRTCAIYSWDNVAKARLFTPSDIYLLWSRYMYDQMRLFYPEIPESSLRITGTPQFSFYFNEAYTCEKSVFCRNLNLNPNKPIIVFSGSDQRVSPFDPFLLRDVAEALLQIEASKRPQLIFRRSPADFSNRYDQVLEQYPSITVQDPIWLNEGKSWATAVPTKKDLKNIVALIQHSNMVINVASTMALDAATHNKPCIYLSYHPEEARAKGWPKFNDTHQEDHFKVMRNIDAVVYVDHENDLNPTINKLLSNPGSMATGRKEYLKIITDNLFTTASSDIAKELQAIHNNNLDN